MTKRQRLIRAVWQLYIALLLLFVIMKFDGSLQSLHQRLFSGEPSSNLVPFRTLRIQWHYLHTAWGRRNLLGNFLPFLPLGFLSPSAFPALSRPGRFFPFALAFLLFAELFQLVTHLGSFDVDDLLLNLLGAALGYRLHPLLTKKA